MKGSFQTKQHTTRFVFLSLKSDCKTQRNNMEKNIKKETYLIEGMSCSGCERTVQRVIGNLEGVASSKADLTTSTVSLEYDPEKVSIDKIKDAVDKIGYKFVGQLPVTGRPGSDEAIP